MYLTNSNRLLIAFFAINRASDFARRKKPAQITINLYLQQNCANQQFCQICLFFLLLTTFKFLQNIQFNWKQWLITIVTQYTIVFRTKCISRRKGGPIPTPWVSLTNKAQNLAEDQASFFENLKNFFGCCCTSETRF